MLKTAQKLPRSGPITTQIGWTWIHTFILVELVFQLLLLSPTFGALRIPMRIAPFAFSLLLMAGLRGNGPKHPATKAAIAVMVILAISLFLHPFTNSILSGAAQNAIYAAILGPLIWVQRLKITPTGFKWLIFLMWGFQTISSIFGVLQVYFPGQFQPALSTTIQNSVYGGENLTIKLADGSSVFRPMGLTDVPGGAASAGLYAMLFGVGIALRERNPILQVACVGSAAIGLFCIYLSQIRAILVFAAICLICLAVVLARKGQFGRLTALIIGGSALVMATFTWAVAVGGESTVARIFTLFDDRADNVYYEHRGHFLEDTLNSIPEYFLGAGLGRWGTMFGYFGDKENPLSQPLWAEIQWTGWLYDGGVPLMIAYVVALFFACRTAWQIAMSQQLSEFTIWGGLIFAYNIAAVALTFSYPLFNSQGGMEFWLLNTSLFVAAYQEWLQNRKRSPRVT